MDIEALITGQLRQMTLKEKVSLLSGLDAWAAEPGEYQVSSGRSSQDICLQGSFYLSQQNGG